MLLTIEADGTWRNRAKQQSLGWVLVFVSLQSLYCICRTGRWVAPQFALAAILIQSDCTNKDMWDFMKDAVHNEPGVKASSPWVWQWEHAVIRLNYQCDFVLGRTDDGKQKFCRQTQICSHFKGALIVNMNISLLVSYGGPPSWLKQ